MGDAIKALRYHQHAHVQVQSRGAYPTIEELNSKGLNEKRYKLKTSPIALSTCTH